MSQKTNKSKITAEKIRKYAIVIFLTILVWVWAYNDLEETITVTATLDIAKNENSDVFVQFDRPTPVPLNLLLKGTASKINKLSAALESGKENLNFTFNPHTQKKIPEYLDVLSFLRESSKTRELGITIESSDVSTIKIEKEKLVKKNLNIRVVDNNGTELNYKSVIPSTVDVFVRERYTGPATVMLSEENIQQARKDYIMKKPAVRLSPGKFRTGDLVKISLPPVELPDRNIQIRMIGFSFSQGLMGNYKIELLNPDELKTTTQLKATQEAFEAYKLMPVQIFVVALDGDEKKEQVTREVVYNFPHEYEAKGEIRLTSSPREAKFKVVPIK